MFKDNELVTLYWTEYKKELRILYETVDEKILELLIPNDETGKGALEIAQIGTERVRETDNPFIGMCYLIKLSDGKAIIIDGGFDNEPCVDNLYNSLGKMGIAKDENGKFAISAWIFSHGHDDHIGIMTPFAKKYADKVNIDFFLYNLPCNQKLVSLTGLEMEFHSFCKSSFPESTFVTPHAGVKYYIGNAIIDMLYTPDLSWTPDAPIDFYNNTSLIFKLEGGGASLLSYGDAGENASEIIWKRYDRAVFNSDILQITHHGLTTGTGENAQKWEYLSNIYSAAKASYAFLPMHSRYPGDKRNGRYSVLIGWCDAGCQISYVMNEKDNHGKTSISQEYYDDFCKNKEKYEKNTLYGYDGINKVVNEKGLITYLGSNETSPMITVFSFESGKITLKENQSLYLWLKN
ncbi:MAG: MBL fold metallo-hydrolase [Ruminococcaceae bacterium]|nr:MBL fold metallo-hydrolase [Oscillospiraceae bacterium]